MLFNDEVYVTFFSRCKKCNDFLTSMLNFSRKNFARCNFFHDFLQNICKNQTYFFSCKCKKRNILLLKGGVKSLPKNFNTFVFVFFSSSYYIVFFLIFLINIPATIRFLYDKKKKQKKHLLYLLTVQENSCTIIF